MGIIFNFEISSYDSHVYIQRIVVLNLIIVYNFIVRRIAIRIFLNRPVRLVDFSEGLCGAVTNDTSIEVVISMLRRD